MESTKKWHSCRLTVYEDSGRVRWCVGQESTWKSKIKVLAFLPVILLAVLIIPVFYKYNSQRDVAENYTLQSVTTNYQDSEIFDNEEREILNSIKTSFIPRGSTPYGSTKEAEDIRHKRDLSVLINSSSEFSTSNKSESLINKTLEQSETKVLNWKIHKPIADIVINLEVEETLKRENKGNDNYWEEHSTRDEVRSKQAHTMRQYMNPEIDPCNDFYKFACGNWEKYNPIPPDKAGYDTFEKLRENLDNVLKDILLEDHEGMNKHARNSHLIIETIFNNSFYINNDNATDPFIKAKKLFKSCINEDIINQRAEKPLLDLLEDLGGWPVIDDNWDESRFDWLWLIAQLRLYNNDILISEWIGPDIKNSNLHVIQLDQTTLGLPNRDYFIEESNVKYLEAYRIYMITAANLLGAPILKATQDADKMIDFETNLATILASQYERRNLTEIYSRMSLGELQGKIPQIDWLYYMRMVVHADIGPEEPIVCFCIKYLQQLVQLLSKTPPRTIANYALWRFVRHRINNLDVRFLEAKQRFFFVLYGREQLPPRWQTCVSQVNSNMGMALGHLFIKKYYDEESRNDTMLMTKNILHAFYSLLSDVKWLDKETKILAQYKIKAMQLRIGYPDYILDIAELTKRYMDVVVNENQYFENILSILEHLAHAEQSRLNVFVNKSVWNTPPAIVNAYYSRNKNQIMFPAGILQPPFYHRHFPRSLNYGGIGVVIGHEITHGFDDKGRLFDKEGNLQRWWKDKAIDAFYEQAQCLIDQYNSYIVPEIGITIDGVNTQGENIADNGGIKQAFKAYIEWLKRNPDVDESLPDLNMTNQQLFFLNFAQVWCGTSRPVALMSKLKTAVHAPGRFRVIGSISNSEDFARAYNCPAGSPMNPKYKCNIW